jgi:hypothetical protein
MKERGKFRLDFFPSGSSGSAGPGSGAMTPSTPPLGVRPPSCPRAVVICGTRPGRSSGVPPPTLDKNKTSEGDSSPLRLLALLDDMVFMMIGFRNCGRCRPEQRRWHQHRIDPFVVVEVR